MLKVVIVGAGITGLACAVSLRRAGHRVRLYEQSSLNNEVGAAITIPPNSARVLLAWGVEPAEWGFVRSVGSSIDDPFTMDRITAPMGESTALDAGGVHLYLAHRVDLHNCLKWLATKEDGLGEPAVVYRANKVVSYDPLKPSITLQDGRVIHADVVVGADGVHSKAAEAILQRKVEAIAPQHSNIAYRFLIAASVLDADPETKFWNERNMSRATIFPDNKTQRRLVSYPCRNNTVHNFVGLQYDKNARQGTEDWGARVNAQEVLDLFSDFHPDLVKVIRKATDVGRWPLLYRYPLEKWHRGMLVVVGDAAHPMLPHQGQGGAQGIEDGLVLGVALHGVTSQDDIQERFQIFQDVRRNRVSVIQILSNIGQDQAEQLKHEVLPFLEEDKIPTNPTQIQAFNFGYDAVDVAVEAMRRSDPGFSLPHNFFDRPVIGVPSNKKAVTPGQPGHCATETGRVGAKTVEIS